MAMTEEQGTTLLSRLSGGEKLRDVLDDMEITQPDFRAWKVANKAAFFAARRASVGKPGDSLKQRRLARLTVMRDQAQDRLDAIDAEIAEAEAE